MYPAHIVTMSEADIPERAVAVTERTMREHDTNILWGDHVTFNDNIEKNVRRVAMGSSNLRHRNP